MTVHNSAKRARKYHHLTCSNCRRRKTKCDGTEPICTTCKGFGDVNCTYDKPASIAYVRHLEKQVQSLSKELDNFKIGGDGPQQLSGSSPALDADVRLPPHHTKRSPAAFGITDQELDILMGKGGVAYLNAMTTMNQKEHLSSLAGMAGKLEDYALEAALTGPLAFLGFNMAKQLMSYFWSWMHPYHMHIYRPLFFRHMATFDPNLETPPWFVYSPALLCMILAEGSRILTGIESDLYQVLDKYAYRFLMQDLAQTSTLATVSSCILLSSRAMALGKSSQSWNFFGIAVRMGNELNVPTVPEKLNSDDITVDEAEARRRMAWFLFQHDQVMSLYYDREPVVQTPDSSPDDILDDCLDIVIWDPVIEVRGSSKLFVNADGQFDDSGEEQAIYNPNKSGYLVECFRWQCKLSRVMNTIVKTLRGDVTQIPGSSSGSENGNQFTIAGAINELEAFWRTVPDSLKITPDNSKTLPHVVSFNLSYQVCFSLLLLPIFQQCTPQNIDRLMIMNSVKSVSEIRQSLASHVATFGTNCTPFYHTYSAYLAYQLLQVSLTEFSERPQSEFDRRTVVDNLNFLTRSFKVCAYALPVVDSTIAYAHNRTRREVAFASQRAHSAVATTMAPHTGHPHQQLDFLTPTAESSSSSSNFPGSLGITFDSSSNSGDPGLTRHMSLDATAHQPTSSLTDPSSNSHSKYYQLRSKSIVPTSYTTQPPQLSPNSPNHLQESPYLSFPDGISRSLPYNPMFNSTNTSLNESWSSMNPYMNMGSSEFEGGSGASSNNNNNNNNGNNSPSPRTLHQITQPSEQISVPVSSAPSSTTVQWQEPEQLS